MIEIKNVNFKYDKKEEYTLRNINLTISKGECVLLCGKSGCGKSTLLKIMNGIIPEFYGGQIHGSVGIDGMKVWKV